MAVNDNFKNNCERGILRHRDTPVILLSSCQTKFITSIKPCNLLRCVRNAVRFIASIAHSRFLRH